MANITTAQRDELIGLYTGMTGFAPGTTALAAMVTLRATAGKTLFDVANSLATDPLFTAAYPSYKTTSELTSSIVTNLLGNEVSSASAVKYATDWVTGQLAGGATVQAVIAAATQALITSTNTDFAKAQTMLVNKIAVGNYATVTKGITTNTSVSTVTSATTTVDAIKTTTDTQATAAATQTFNLTTGIDSGPAYTGGAGNDSFIAVPVGGVDTLTALDQLDGGGGTNTLSVAAVAAMTVPAGVTVKNIQTATLSGTTVTADVSGWTGLTSLIPVSSGATTITAANTTNITQASSVNNVTITGGNNVTINQSTAGAVTVDQAAGAVNVTSTVAGAAGAYVQAAAGTVSVTQSAAVPATGGAVTINAKGNIQVTGGTSLVANITDSTAIATRKANIASASSAAFTKTFVTDVAVTSATAKNTALGTTMANAIAAATTIDACNAATLTQLVAGYITPANKAAIDSAFATALNAVGGTAALAQAAALAVYTPIVNAAASALVTANTNKTAQDATVTAANALVAADAGVTAHLINATTNTALASATATGNYTSTVLFTDGSSGNNKLTTVVLDNAGTATLTGNAITNVSISNEIGNTAPVTITNNTVGHTQNLTLKDVGTPATALAGAVGINIADAAATTVNITSNGTENAVVLNTPLATAVNITGAGKFTAVNTLNGGNTLTLAANAVIDASKTTGNNTVVVGVGQSYLGGSGADVVFTGATLQTAPVSGGDGTADKLVVTNTANIAVNLLGTGSAEYTGFEILEDQAVGAINLATDLTGNTFTSVILKPTAGSATATATVNGLNATQAGAVTISTAPNNVGYTLGVTGATNVGQLDTVKITAGAALGPVTLAGVETLNIAPTAGTSFDMANALALTSINVISGAQAVNISTGAIALNVNTTIDAHLSTGKTFLNAAGSTGNGIKLVGSASGNDILTGNAQASVLTGGDGHNIIRGGAAADVITAGNGNNTITGGGGADTITVGNGYNVITGGAAADTITVGTGGNFITTGGGLDVVTLGTHTLGTIDTIDLTGQGRNAANVVTVAGFVSGTDRINLPAGNGNAVNGLNFTAAHTANTMLAAVTDTTAVNSLADVYTELASARGLDNSAGHEFAASAAATNGIVAREVTFTSGLAAGTYLVINDGVAGFVAANDLVLKLSGSNTTVVAGDITVGKAAPSVAPVEAFTATVSTDNFVGGGNADTFAAKYTNGDGQNTFATADVYVGGTGIDVLTISPSTANGALTLTDAMFANHLTMDQLVISSTGTGAQSITVAAANWEAAGYNKITTSSTSGAITIAAGGTAASDTYSATTTLAGGNIAITAGAAGDTITATAAIGTTTITGGAGADAITLGAHAGVATIIGSLTSSVATSATTIAGATLAAGDVLTFGNGVDTITGFTAGAGKDVLDNTAAAVNAIATGIGENVTTGFATATTDYLLSGTWNATAKTFTVAASGAGPDTLVVFGDAGPTALAASTAEVVLIGVVNTALVAGNFS